MRRQCEQWTDEMRSGFAGVWEKNKPGTESQSRLPYIVGAGLGGR